MVGKSSEWSHSAEMKTSVLTLTNTTPCDAIQNELRKIRELHSSHVGFVIHCISTMPSCDNDGLIANFQHFTSNLFTNYCCIFMNIGKVIHINIYIWVNIYVYVHRLCKIKTNAAAFICCFLNIDIIQRGRLFIFWQNNLIWFTYLAAIREKSCSRQLQCFYTMYWKFNKHKRRIQLRVCLVMTLHLCVCVRLFEGLSVPLITEWDYIYYNLQLNATMKVLITLDVFICS